MNPEQDHQPAATGAVIVWPDRTDYLWPLQDDVHFRIKVYNDGEMTCDLGRLRTQIDHE